MMDITNKGVFVSGGASGLGAGCVRLLVKAGARVVIGDLNTELGMKLADELGESAYFVSTNVTDEESVTKAIEQVVEQCGGLHIAINCAGIGVAERVLGKNGPSSLASFSKVISINLIGTFNVIRLAGAARTKNQHGES